MTTSNLLLPGLDAQNPLGFLAALGLLRILDCHAQTQAANRPCLSFERADRTARIETPLSLDEVMSLVLEDARAQCGDLVLSLAYTEAERVAPQTPRASRDLKPPRAVAAAVLEESSVASRRTADLAAAAFTELVQDNNGNTKPTALHFTAGQQEFLAMVEQLRVGVTSEHLREALLGPWRNESSLPSLAWDSTVTRLYALRASNPSGEKRGSVPAANWLAVQALAFFPVVCQKGRLVTTCVEGGWKNAVFTWPTWNAKLTVPTICSLLRLDLKNLSETERTAAGLDAVFSCKILRSDQGGYGSFAPAAVVLPRTPRDAVVGQ